MRVITASQILKISNKLSWQDAIKEVGTLLVANAYTNNQYTNRMLDTVIKFGPYFVIAPGIAIAHAAPGPDVKKDGLVLMVSKQPIIFNSHNDPVHLVFGLAAKDSNNHIDALSNIANMLGDEKIVSKVVNAKSVEEIAGFFKLD
jgi:PTS system ascorbate-specific IIA component